MGSCFDQKLVFDRDKGSCDHSHGRLLTINENDDEHVKEWSVVFIVTASFGLIRREILVDLVGNVDGNRYGQNLQTVSRFLETRRC